MRTCLSAAALAIAITAPSDAATRNFGITSFERVRVEGPFRVKLSTGVAPFATAEGSSAALDRVAFDMIGQTLVIHGNVSAWGSYSSSDDVGPVEIRVGTHDLTNAALNGSGSLQIDRVTGLSFNASAQGSGQLKIGQADVDQLNVSMIGSASSVVAGRAAMLKFTGRGTSSFDGAALSSKDATIVADGTSTILAQVTGSAKIDGSGPATVTLTGDPACTARLSGAASVTGCRKSQ